MSTFCFFVCLFGFFLFSFFWRRFEEERFCILIVRECVYFILLYGFFCFLSHVDDLIRIVKYELDNLMNIIKHEINFSIYMLCFNFHIYVESEILVVIGLASYYLHVASEYL